jgi:hypothetical protein
MESVSPVVLQTLLWHDFGVRVTMGDLLNRRIDENKLFQSHQEKTLYLESRWDLITRLSLYANEKLYMTFAMDNLDTFLEPGVCLCAVFPKKKKAPIQVVNPYSYLEREKLKRKHISKQRKEHLHTLTALRRHEWDLLKRDNRGICLWTRVEKLANGSFMVYDTTGRHSICCDDIHWIPHAAMYTEWLRCTQSLATYLKVRRVLRRVLHFDFNVIEYVIKPFIVVEPLAKE